VGKYLSEFQGKEENSLPDPVREKILFKKLSGLPTSQQPQEKKKGELRAPQ